MTDFPVPKDSYIAFDGLTIKEKIKDRLNQTGIFTDQNYEGSNLAAINDSIAMSFSLLMYYLNQNSVNGQFSETNIYENINRIVKELDYKPIGHQTASVNFSLSCTNLDAGIYTIPRYSYISIGGLQYSTNKDIVFSKISDTINEPIKGIEDDSVLYQGFFTEYPEYTPAGSPKEVIYLSSDENDLVDSFNIHVYVKRGGVWKKWTKTQSLYINNYEDEVYELRFNENKIYELTFGDNINGKQLLSTDKVLIYYLISDGSSGEIGPNTLVNRKMIPFVTTNLTNILASENVSVLNSTQILNISLDNKFSSTSYSEPESIQSIKRNAPANFKSQFNITKKSSYESFIQTNFSNIVHDVSVKNNKEYLDSYIRYFYNIGITKPQYESRALFNQINYADSCNFNNVYAFIVPKSINSRLSYLAPMQKQLIIDSMKSEQVLTSETIISDPVYILFDICYKTQNIDYSDISQTDLYVIRKTGSKRSEFSIKEDIQNKILEFFNISNNKLGSTLNVQQLNAELLSIDGVGEIYTRNTIDNTILEGVRFVNWNPVYFEQTIRDTPTSIIKLESFQFPHLSNHKFIDRIVVK